MCGKGWVTNPVGDLAVLFKAQVIITCKDQIDVYKSARVMGKATFPFSGFASRLWLTAICQFSNWTALKLMYKRQVR